jgi:hypothetical protein
VGIKIAFKGHHFCFSLINYVINTQVESNLSSLDAIKQIASIICAIRLLQSYHTNKFVLFFVYTVIIERVLTLWGPWPHIYSFENFGVNEKSLDFLG